MLSQSVGRAFYGPRALRQAQREALEPVLDGADVLVVAGTGSGKTEAVLAPVVDRHLDALVHGGGPVVVYLTPTRALANDLVKRLQQPLDSLHVRLGVQHGERKDLGRKERPTLLVTTPESLDNLLVDPRRPLAEVRAVVVDEVHQLAGTQRGLQVRRLVNRLEALLGRPVQLTAMSATVAEPQQVWARVRDSVPVVVEVPDARRRRYVLRRDATEQGLADWFARLQQPRKALVFCNSRRESEQLGALLSARGVFDGRVFVHHSALDRALRLDVEEKLQSRERAVCVATSTLELGIDIGDIDLVVLCGPPSDWRSFGQRLGRGNRRSDEVDVVCLVPPWSRRPAWDAAVFHALVEQAEGRSPRESEAGPLYGATGQQVVSHLRGAPEWVGKGELVTALGADVEPVLDDVLASLVEHDLLQRHPVRPRWGLSRGYETAEQRMEVWGNFPTSSSRLDVVHRGRRLGEVPFGNVLRLEPGATFALLGQVWRVVRVLRGRVDVERGTGAPAVQLVYDSPGARLDPTLVELVPDVVRAASPLAMGASTRVWWEGVRTHVGGSLSGVPCWRSGTERVHATFAGQLLNEAVARLTGSLGGATEATVTLPVDLDLAGLPPFGGAWAEAVVDYLENPAELTPWQQRLPPDLLRQELLGPFLTHPVYPRTVERLRRSQLVRLDDDRLTALAPEVRTRRTAG